MQLDVCFWVQYVGFVLVMKRVCLLFSFIACLASVYGGG